MISKKNKAPRILITAGEPAGIGPDLIIKLSQIEHHYDLTIIGDPDLLNERAKLLSVPLRITTISDDNILFQLPTDFDYIFHLATYHGNQSSMKNPLEDHDNNTITLQLKKLVYASAGCVVAEKTYDKPNATAEDANISLYLDSPYQISKMIGEFYGNYYYK